MNPQATAIEAKKVTSIAPVQQEPINMIDRILEKAELNTNTLDLVERLMTMQEKEKAKQQEIAFNQSFSQAQSEIKSIQRNKRNNYDNYDYADLDAVNKEIMPVISKHGLTIRFKPFESHIAGHIGMKAIISHVDGYSDTSALDVPYDDKGRGGKVTKTGIQALGSSITYAQRYLLLTLFNLATTSDNDGASVSVSYITPNQVNELEKIIANTGANKDRLLRAIGCNSLEIIFSDKFEDVKKLILQRVQTNG